jgi:hypothetical protein
VAMRTLDAYLTARPDAFTIAVTDCPVAYLRLVQALLAAGNDVAVPACADCGRQDTGLRTRTGVRYCHRCYARRGIVLCARCGASGRVAARRPEGVICYACYARDPLVTEACAACGKVRVPATRQPDGQPLCEACYQRPQQVCSKCGALARVKAHGDDGPLCQQCYTHHLRPPALVRPVRADTADRAAIHGGYPGPVRQLLPGRHRHLHGVRQSPPVHRRAKRQAGLQELPAEAETAVLPVRQDPAG